ncbi:hypothetical protein [Microbispora rosea]|uniref:hypothetical protein n=1 Tax=Microbispora rosea TaxID=58117 RepID=UPI000690CD71|nr:hypothetical protein [Microbispora rosea]
MELAFPAEPTGPKRGGALRALGAILAALTVILVLPGLAAPASATTTATTITDPAFYDLESGTIASATGLNGGDSTRLRLKTAAAVDGSWRTLAFTEAAGNPDIDVTVFAYDADGTYLSPSTGWQSLVSPYTYTIPAGTATIRYVVKYHAGGAITPADHATWLTIGVAGIDDGTTAPPSTSDPGFNDFEQGTIASATGVKRDGASDVATRIRLKAPVAVDRSWQALKFDGGPKGSDVSVTIFAYDADGTFLSPSTGWKSLASPYVYVIPTGTAKISYVLSHDAADSVQPINVSERNPWVTLSTVKLDPRDNYKVNASTVTPQFTIPGMHDEQGGNFVDGKLWIGAASDDGHTVANGHVYVYDIDYAAKTATLAHTFKHDFGHLNSFSYDEASGNLIFGNGSSSYTQAPEFYVVKESNIDLDGTNTLDGLHATAFDVPDDFGAKCNVIWTDQPDTAVMLTDDGTTVRKIKLAVGTEHGQYGVYAPAAGAGYNGTWDLLATYHINTAYDVVQSAAWVRGRLVIGLGHGPMSIAVIDLQDDGHMDYEVYRNPAQSQYFEAVFYDPDNRYFGGVNANTGAGYFWDDTNFSFTATPPAPVVTGVSVTPSAVTVSRGATQSFTATVTGDGHPAQSVTWSVSGNASTGTTVDGEGLLTVAPDETARALTVAATSTADASRSATATVAVPPPGTFGGFKPPVKPDGVTAVHAGRTIPIKWTIDGEQDGEPAVVSATFDEPGADYHWIGELGSYHLNVGTPRSWAGSRHTFTVTLADGSLHRAEFSFE